MCACVRVVSAESPTELLHNSPKIRLVMKTSHPVLFLLQSYVLGGPPLSLNSAKQHLLMSPLLAGHSELFTHSPTESHRVRKK